MEIYKRIMSILLCAVLLAVLLPCALPVYGEISTQLADEADADTCVMLQAGNLPGYYVKDIMGVPTPDFNTVKIVQYSQDDDCAKWKLVPGLAAPEGEDGYVSFESVNFPGYYLRRIDGNGNQMILSELATASNPEEFKKRATFLKEEGIFPKTSETTYSFSLLGSSPKRYIRHARSVIYVDPYEDDEGNISEGTQKDATFYLHESVENDVVVSKLEAAHYSTAQYLRHLGIPLKLTHQVKIAVWDGRYNTDWDDNGQWRIVRGLAAGENDTQDYVSFESKIRPGCYLKKAYNGDYVEVESLQEAIDSGNEDEFKRNATFLREDALINPNTLTNKEIQELSMPLIPEEWHSYSLYRRSEEEPKLYLRHSNYGMYVQSAAGWDNGGKGTAIFRENADHRVVISKETLANEDIESIVIKDSDGNVVQPGQRFPAETKLYVTTIPKEGYAVTRILVRCESSVPDCGYAEMVNGGYAILPHTDTAFTVYTEHFVPTPEAFVHPGVAVNREWLENMKTHIRAGDKMWVDEFNLLKSLGHASKTPRILWQTGGSEFGDGYLDLDNGERGQVVWDATTAYVQALMWYITGEEVYRENALGILDRYAKTNSMLVYVNDDRIRVSLAVVKFVVAAEILRYSEFDGSEDCKWQDKHTEGFTKYLNLMRSRYDRYWHYMNQHNFCVAATAAAAIFRNDLELYNKAIQRITTNPERCENGALCDRNALGNGRCYTHANSGDIISQIREVTVNQLTGEEVEPNLQLIELGRDIGHAYCDVGYFSYLAYTALIQGTKVNNDSSSVAYGVVSNADDAVNLFEFAGHRILKGANYIVKYTLGYDTLYVPSLVGGDYRNPTIFKQISDERGGPKNEYWNRFDAVCTGIYNYYRYYDEGRAAVKSGEVSEEDMKYLEQAVIRLHPESLDAANFIGFGTLLYSGVDPEDSDTISEKEYPALQNATVDAANPDEVFADDGYLYTGGSYNTYVQFDMSKIDEAELGALTTLGLEVRHSDKDPGQNVMIDFKLYTGDWEQNTATYNSLRSLTEITNIKPPKSQYLRINSFNSRHLLQDVISDLKANDKYKNAKITFRLRQTGEEAATETNKADCAKVLSISGTDNSHARPRLVTHKIINSNEVPPPDESGYEQPGERLFTQKTNFKDFGYVVSDNKGTDLNSLRLTKISNTENDVLLGYLPTCSTAVYYLGEGDLTDLKKVYYWVGHERERDITLYYTRVDDDYLKMEKLDFALNEGVAEDSFAVKRYYSSRAKLDEFIEKISGNVLATGKTSNNRWNCNTKYELTVSDNVPKGRYKVFMVTMSGDQAYVQFKYKNDWDISFNKSAKTVNISAAEGEEPLENDELTVYAAVHEKGNGRLKDIRVKKLSVVQGNGIYTMDFSDLSAFGSDDVVRVFLWNENQIPEGVKSYTVQP